MGNSAQTSVGSHIAALFDENSFVEVGACITTRSIDFNMAEQEASADSVVTGHGIIGGRLMYVYSRDVSVLDGSISGVHAREICNIYSMAMKMGAPVIDLVDCTGLRLQEATNALDGSDKLYSNQTMTSGMASQIAAIFGTHDGDMAVSAGITNLTFMEEKPDELLVNSPSAIDGNYKEKCNISSVDFQNGESGPVDFTGDRDSTITQIYALVSILPANNESDMSHEECQDDLDRTRDNVEGCTGDMALALTLISDNSFFIEIRKDYEPFVVIGFTRLNGTTIGCVANRAEIYESGEKKETFEPVLSGKDCDRTASLINFCDVFNIPIFTLVNVKDCKVGMCSERRIAGAIARLTYACANTSVSEVAVTAKEAFGSVYLTTGSKSIGAGVAYIWLDIVIGMTNPFEAVKIMYTKEVVASGNVTVLINEKTTEYTALQSSTMAAARRGYVDGTIKAGETRQRVITAFEMLFTEREDRPFKKRGTVQREVIGI